MVGSRTRRRLSPEARRTELIDAAIRLLHSGQQISNWAQAVTAEADAAKGTFYVYFASWEEMLLAVRERVLHNYATRLQHYAETTGPIDWWHALDTECDAAIDFIGQPGGLHEVVFHSTAALTPADDAHDLIAATGRLLRRAIDDGAFRAVDPHITATVLIAILHAAADAIAAGGPPLQWRQAIRDLTRRWLTPP